MTIDVNSGGVNEERERGDIELTVTRNTVDAYDYPFSFAYPANFFFVISDEMTERYTLNGK